MRTNHAIYALAMTLVAIAMMIQRVIPAASLLTGQPPDGSAPPVAYLPGTNNPTSPA